MGATHSKKPRKEKERHKKRRSSLGPEMRRSASVDSLHHRSSSSSSCPMCPHCRSSPGWSSDHSLTHSLCLQHARRGRGGADSGWGGQGRGTEVWPKGVGLEPCPACSLPWSSSKDVLRLCEISNQDYDELSTMSLNRQLPAKSQVKPGSIVQSRSAEFPALTTGVGGHGHAKENVNPDLPDPVPPRKTWSVFVRDGSTAKRHSPSPDPAPKQTLSPVVRSSSSPSSSSFTHPVGNSHQRKDKSNPSLLEDEDVVMSRWVKQKKMAQELRSLRIHLQNQEVVKMQTTLPQSSCTDSHPRNVLANKSVDLEQTAAKDSLPSPITTSSEDDVTAADTIRHQQKKCSTDASPPPVTQTESAHDSALTNPNPRPDRSKFSRLSNYRFLDNHPALTRLQNEQNSRLERMERRMEGIRLSAMQEAHRRKFAQIFPAKSDDSETQKLLREARESLERMKEEKRQKALCLDVASTAGPARRASLDDGPGQAPEGDPRSLEDSGEIIPVHVMTWSREVTPVPVRSPKTVASSRKHDQPSQWSWLTGEWPDINLGQPLTWLWLPFLLFPLVLRMLVSLLTDRPPASATPSPATAAPPPNLDGNRNNLSRQRRKKSC